MMSFWKRVSACSCLVMSLWTVQVIAQTDLLPESPEAMAAARAEQRYHMHRADSMGDLAQRIGSRFALAAIVPQKEAMVLYMEALHLADSAGWQADAVAAHTALADILASKGQAKQAYTEARAALHVSERMFKDSLLRLTGEFNAATRQATAERDSLGAALSTQAKEAGRRIDEAHEEADWWMWSAIGIGLAALLVILLLAHGNRKALRAQRREIAELRDELSAFAERERNRARAAADAPVTVPPSTAVEPLVGAPPSVGMEPVLVAMFQKQAPERLATLREARRRGDHEKVQRVVHTLKPQLVNFEASFADLCARITEAGAPAEVQRWNADLDAFESGVTRLLG